MMINATFMDELLAGVIEAEDTFEVCRILVDASFGEDYRLSDEQFDIFMSIFTESEVAASAVIFLHNFEEFTEDFFKIKELYTVIHDKFAESNFPFDRVKNITA